MQFQGGGEWQKQKFLKKSMELHWNFWRGVCVCGGGGGWGKPKYLSVGRGGGGMDIFWNHTYTLTEIVSCVDHNTWGKMQDMIWFNQLFDRLVNFFLLLRFIAIKQTSKPTNKSSTLNFVLKSNGINS